MEVIGRKKRGIAIGFFSCLFAFSVPFVALLISTIACPVENPMLLFIPIIIIIIFLIPIIIVTIITVRYLKIPNDYIKYNRIDTIFINEKKINLVDILNVSYKKSTGGMWGDITFEYGTITVQTKSQTYKVRYVDKCESVCKLITKLAYDFQNKPQE